MTSQNGSNYFGNASNSVFNNTTVTHVSGDLFSGSSPKRDALNLLLDNISKGAFHDAAERGDPPRCHPHTRTAIRAEIMKWVQTRDTKRKLILWMYGPAGSGKTAIAQSIAEECKRKGLLAASFFFGRAAAGRNDATHFIATIAYQLSQSMPQICEHILSAVEQNPTIFSRALATQMQVLLIEPLQALPTSPRPIFVITDGVDECGPNREAQTTLLNALETIVSELQHIPLIFLVASRPEYEIREAFNGDLFSPLVRSLVLDDAYQPDDDIRLYLKSKFQEIHLKHLRLGSRLPSPWPATSDVDLLVSKASGQFIFAATVTKFIDSSRHNPLERLEIILGLSTSGNETPFSLLDALYHFILSSVANLPKVLEILTLLMLGNYTVGYFMDGHPGYQPLALTVNIVESLLDFAIGPVLIDMHALIFIPPPTDHKSSLRIHHASFLDYLTVRSRSHNHYIDITQGHIILSRYWLKLMTNYPDLPPPLSLTDCVEGFLVHCNKIITMRSEIADDLASFSLKKLLCKVHSYEYLYHPCWNNFFACVEIQARAQADVFPRLRDEFDAFVFECISQYPPALRALIPTVVVYGASQPDPSSFFTALLFSLYPSKTEPQLAHIDNLSQTLLGLGRLNITYTTLAPLFQDRSRAGQIFVDGGSYARLAKQVVRVADPMLRGFDTAICARTDYSNWFWFPGILRMASEDWELAALLRDRVLQYDSTVRITRTSARIAEVSLSYIQRCGMPYLKHTHRPNTDRCIVCEKHGNNASVVCASSIVRAPPLPMSEPLPWAGFIFNLTVSMRPFWFIQLLQTVIP